MVNKGYKYIFILLALLCLIVLSNVKKKRYIPVFKNKKEVLDIFSEVEKLNLEDFDFHASVNVLEGGYDLYEPDGSGYRYGPSIIYYEDGSLDVWFSSPGNNSDEWDYIRYRHCDGDGNWSDEKVVLTPNDDSLDCYSVCDPGVIYFNGYYYLGYTSTSNSSGYDNNIFVCRSENPDGPFEKWNGESWGGDPVPIVEFNSDESYWGAGEISFCIRQDKLYCYYTWIGEDGWVTKVATADLCEDWPNTFEYQGVAFARGSGEDSCDVVYVEKYDMFIALAIEKRFSEQSNVAVYESYDGIVFNKADAVKNNVVKYAHNIGISKKMDGSIGLDDDLYICYAYCYSENSWGRWPAYIQPIEIDIYLGDLKYN